MLLVRRSWARYSSFISEDALWYVGGVLCLFYEILVHELDADTVFVKAIYTMNLTIGSAVGSVAGGYIVANMGLPWLHWINVILSAVNFALCLVIQPETLYKRPQTTVTFDDDSPDKQTFETKERITVPDSAPPSSYPPYSYLKSLRLITYQPGIVGKFLAPYKVLRLPGVWLVGSWYAGLVGLIVSEHRLPLRLSEHN
jgi:MFS family permease